MKHAAAKVGAGVLAFSLLFGTAGYVSLTPKEQLPEDLLSLKADLTLEVPKCSFGDTIVDMAQKEYDFYREHDLTGGARYWNMVREALGWSMPGEAWCVCFVLCCAYQCGYIAPDGCFGDFAENGGNWIFWVGGLYDYLVDQTHLAQGYNRRCDYKPQAGDLVLFSPTIGSSEPDHIGIVASVDESGHLATIEGNSHNAVRSNIYESYEIGSFAYQYHGQRVLISGYIHPVYPAPEEPPTEPTAPTEPTEPLSETAPLHFEEKEAS